MSKDLIASWDDGGAQGEGVVKINDSVVQILANDASMNQIYLSAGDERDMAIRAMPFADTDLSGGFYFRLSVIQKDPTQPPISDIVGGADYDIDKEGWECVTCSEEGNQLQAFSSSQMFYQDTVVANQNYAINSGTQIEFKQCVLLFEEGTGITVNQGGKLILKNCELRSKCLDKKWAGIIVNGSTTATNAFTVTHCHFKGTDSPVIAKKAEGILIEKNAILGSGYGNGIAFENCGQFIIEDNFIVNFENGVVTKKTYTTTIGASIEKNKIQKSHTAISMHVDDHRSTVIRCNTLNYTEYGIFSDSCQLNDFGNSNESAGNKFKGKSGLQYNKIKHSNGNAPHYYYDPLNPDSANINISTVAAAENAQCFSFDSTRTQARSLPAAITELTNEVGITIIPNPGNGNIIVRLSNMKGAGRIIVHDVQGKQIFFEQFAELPGDIPLNFSGKSTGIYFLTLVRDQHEINHEKILISN